MFAITDRRIIGAVACILVPLLVALISQPAFADSVHLGTAQRDNSFRTLVKELRYAGYSLEYNNTTSHLVNDQYVITIPVNGNMAHGLVAYTPAGGGQAAAFVYTKGSLEIWTADSNSAERHVVSTTQCYDQGYDGDISVQYTCSEHCSILCNAGCFGACAYYGISVPLCYILCGYGCSSLCNCVCYNVCPQESGGGAGGCESRGCVNNTNPEQ